MTETLRDLIARTDHDRDLLLTELGGTVRAIPLADPVEARLTAMDRKIDRVLDLLEWKGPVQ